MATVTGITLVKAFEYRGNADEEFSNTYHFKNPPPGDSASWKVLVDDLVARERLIFRGEVKYQRAYGYDSNDPGAHHVYALDWVLTGNAPIGGYVGGTLNAMAGDQASLCQWRLDRLNSRGKPIYLRKYFHNGVVDPADADRLEVDYEAALNTFAGGAGGVSTLHGGLRSASQDDNNLGHLVSPWVTTRTLKRRGKRPRTGS